MLDREKVCQWLIRELSSWPDIDAYMFGSFLDLEGASPSDVDIYVCYEMDKVCEIVERKAFIQKKFFSDFGKELHFLLLTKEESVEFKDFLEKALATSRYIIAR